jgi:NADPH:quinone reductase-like Zn-dependent oxidoreductase
MPRAVRFAAYGGTEVLQVVEVDRPRPGPGELLVEVVVAGVNPGEIGIREGLFADIWPARFPEGQGNDFSGRVVEAGPGGGGFDVGDEVMGFAPRAAQADFVVAPAGRLARKPANLAWESAAVLPAVGATAYAAVQAVDLHPGDTVVVSAAAGGVGVVSAQLARLAGARVIGTAGEANAEFLRSLGVEPVRHGARLAERIRAVAPAGVDAYLDHYGAGNVEVALALGVSPARINTIADGLAAREHGTRSDAQAQADSPAIWEYLAGLAAAGQLIIPIHRVYPLERVREAYDELARRHTRGKIVLQVHPGHQPPS